MPGIVCQAIANERCLFNLLQSLAFESKIWIIMRPDYATRFLSACALTINRRCLIVVDALHCDTSMLGAI